jgi:hypothetical protein
MKKLSFVLLAGVAIFTASCDKEPFYPPIPEPEPEYCVAPVNNSGSGWEVPPTTAAITEAHIEGDYLKVALSYTGAEPRQFDLDWDGTINNEQANLTITDYGYPDDPNGAEFLQTQCYDLISLRTAEHGYVTLNRLW